MAIQSNNSANTANTANTASAAQQAPQYQQQTQQAPNQPRRAGFLENIQRMSSGYVSQYSNSEYFTKMREAVGKAAAECLQDGLVGNVLGINGKEYGLKFSAIVLAISFKERPNLIAYHTLLLEATGDKLKGETITLSGKQVFVRRVTSDAIDPVLIRAVNDVVERAHNNAQVLYAAAQVVPAVIQITDTDTINAIIRNAAMACVSQIQRATKTYEAINLNELQSDYRMEVQVVTSSQPSFDEVGNPIRASFQINTNFVNSQIRRDPRQQLDLVNVDDGNVKFSELTGFVNTVWNPQTSGLALFGQPQQINKPKLTAEAVITAIRTPVANSPAAVELALASVYAVADKHNWAQMLVPSGRTDIPPTTDIGAFNLICDIFNEKKNGLFGTPTSITTCNGDMYKISQYLSAIYQPDMMISLDCAEAGTNSWYTNLFVAAAYGDVDAIAMIIEAANESTGGYFSQIYNPADPILVAANRIPMGYYLVDGKKRDIRDIDLNFICSVYANSPAQVYEYNDTFYPRQGYDEVTNLAAREGLITHAARDQIEITGYARRVTFGGGFLRAYSKAIEACRVNTVVNTPLASDQFRQGTMAPEYIQQALLGSTSTFHSFGDTRRSVQFGNLSQFSGIHR